MKNRIITFTLLSICLLGSTSNVHAWGWGRKKKSSSSSQQSKKGGFFNRMKSGAQQFGRTMGSGMKSMKRGILDKMSPGKALQRLSQEAQSAQLEKFNEDGRANGYQFTDHNGIEHALEISTTVLKKIQKLSSGIAASYRSAVKRKPRNEKAISNRFFNRTLPAIEKMGTTAGNALAYILDARQTTKDEGMKIITSLFPKYPHVIQIQRSGARGDLTPVVYQEQVTQTFESLLKQESHDSPESDHDSSGDEFGNNEDFDGDSSNDTESDDLEF